MTCTGQADGAAVVGDGAADGLADPPGGVGRELEAAAELEAVDRLHQADVAFLDQIEQRQAAIRVALGDRHHQPQVGFEQLALGLADHFLLLAHPRGDLAEPAARQAGALFERVASRGPRSGAAPRRARRTARSSRAACW